MANHQDRDETPEDTPAPPPKSPAESAREREFDRRARFARGTARSEFGRFYWDDEREKQMRWERRRRPPGGKPLKPRKPSGR